MKPYTDQYMRYDTARHRYVLTLAYGQDMRNINMLDLNDDSELNDNNAPDQLLEKISRAIYNHIYRHAMHRYRTERELATDAVARQAIMDAMGDQLEWIVTNGDTYNIADRDLPGICPMAHETLAAAGLLFSGNNSGERRDITPTYEEDGY